MMTTKRTLLACCLSLLAGLALAAKPIADKDLGLSKTDVKASPAPAAYAYPSAPPGSSTREPTTTAHEPPAIPHDISAFVPVTLDNNLCKGCHDKPSRWGMPKIQGLATSIPKSHYTDLRRSPGTVGKQVVGARYVCTQCHRPRSNAKPLVANQF